MNIELRSQSKQILSKQLSPFGLTKNNLKLNHINQDVLILKESLEQANLQIQHKNKLIHVLLQNKNIIQIKQVYQSKVHILQQKVERLKEENQKLNLNLLLKDQIQAQNEQENLYAITYYQQKILQLRQALINKQIMIHRFEKNSNAVGLGLFHQYEQINCSLGYKHIRQNLQIYEKMYKEAESKIKQLEMQILKQNSEKQTLPKLNLKRKKQNINSENDFKNVQKDKQMLSFNSPTKLSVKLQKYRQNFDSFEMQKLKMLCFKTYKQNQQLKKVLFESQQEKLKFKIKSQSLIKSFLLMEKHIKQIMSQISILKRDNQALKNIIMQIQKQLQKNNNEAHISQRNREFCLKNGQKQAPQSKNSLGEKSKKEQKISVIQLLKAVSKIKQQEKNLIQNIKEKQQSIMQQKSIIKAQLERSRCQFSRTVQFNKKKSLKTIPNQNQDSIFLDDQNISIINQIRFPQGKKSIPLSSQFKNQINLSPQERISKPIFPNNKPAKLEKQQIKGNFNNILENFDFE